MQDGARDEIRDQVTRLVGFLRELVRSRTESIADVDAQPGVVWIGASTPLSPRTSAAPGQVIVEAREGSGAYDELDRLVDELHENPDTLELVVANALLTVGEAENDTAPLIREHLLTQHVIAERDGDGLIRVSLGGGSAPMVHDTHFLAAIDGINLSGALKARTALSEQASVLGTKVTDAFAKYGWCAAIRGVEGGGLVEGLPTHTFATDDGEVALKCPTEIAITDRREKELADLGLIPLVHCKGTDYAAFFSTQSANKQKEYNTDAANANARLSSQLQYIFAVSRIAHYLKSMMRDKIGSFASKSSVELFLNNWIAQYVLLDDNASQEAKAQYPLREARIEVAEVPGKPGAYKSVAFLRPHYQLDELSVSLRLVAELPKSAR